MSSIGDQVKAWRTDPSRRWSVRRMAEAVGTSRQNIENLESGAVEVPSYIGKLADVMDCSVDRLLGRPARPDAGAPTVRETPGTYGMPPLSAALEQVGAALAGVDEAVRTALAENLRLWALERGADHYRELVITLLDRPSGKQRAAGGR